MTDLVAEFGQFLGAMKQSERMSPALREVISVETELESALRSAVVEGRDVVVAGSAGGGKTHLLDVALGDSSEFSVVRWPDDEPSSDAFIRAVPDLTAVPPEERLRTLTEKPAHCRAAVVAVNEGPLLALARNHTESPFAHAVHLLHQGQRGERPTTSPDQPTVIDVGGFDPVTDGVPGRMLQLPILRDLVDASECSCDRPSVCPRRGAWRQLDQDEVAHRVDDLLRVANLESRTVLFRELWDFIADLATGGSCEDTPPSSAWFWRVFHGDSALSRRLRDSVDPDLLVFPRAESHLWYGDWFAEALGLADPDTFLPLDIGNRPSPQEFDWLRIQLFFLAAEVSTLELVREQYDLGLVQTIQLGRTLDLVEAINRYMSYGTIPASKDRLTLWTDVGVERRTDRPQTQLSVGSVTSGSLAINSSTAVMNHPDEDVQVNGNQSFLVHPDSGASFKLSPSSLTLLRAGRSFRTSDRPHTDLEWFIARFFSQIARHVEQTDQLDVMQVNFETMNGEHHTYNVSPSSWYIEPTG